jgi:hypothetical protein
MNEICGSHMMTMQVTISLDVTTCDLVDKFQCFVKNYCLSPQHRRIYHAGKDKEKMINDIRENKGSS